MEEVHYKKRIRLLSFQNAHNFGAILQAYGLQQSIKSMGYEDVKFLNYNPNYLSNRYNPFTKDRLFPYKSIKTFLLWCVCYPFYMISTIRRNKYFKQSIKTMLVQTDQQIKGPEGLKEESVDVLVCGSDQIWNTAITGDYDSVFLGEGPYKHLGYAVSYAPSTELSSLTKEKVKRLAERMDNFKFISVREEPVKDYLQKFTKKPVQVCVDPTILCGPEPYEKLASRRLVKNKYILIYAYNPKEGIIDEMVKSISNYKNYEQHIVMLGERGIFTFFKGNYHSEISVQDFLSYIKNASYVVTNSFHGLAFSLLFRKNFNVAYCENKYVRCLSLLKRLDLESRFIRDIESCNWDMPDFSEINEKINKIRQESYSFLNNALKV